MIVKMQQSERLSVIWIINLLLMRVRLFIESFSREKNKSVREKKVL